MNDHMIYRLWRYGKYVDFDGAKYLRAFIVSAKTFYPNEFREDDFAIEMLNHRGESIYANGLVDYKSVNPSFYQSITE